MTLEEWRPEMLCETCKREIDSAFEDENRQEGSEYHDECY